MNRKPDITTLLGLFISFTGVGLGFYLEGGDFKALFSLSAILIIFGGTIGVTIITMSMDQLKSMPKLIKYIFTDTTYDFQGVIDKLCDLARLTRREGIVTLGEIVENEIDDKFMRKGLEYILDGSDYDTIKELLENDINAMIERHEKGASPFEQAGAFAPTLGIVGTVLGLIVVLSGLGNAGADELGRGIATAFLATFMGIASANLIFLPFAETLKEKSSQEVLYRQIIMQGILGIQTGSNPNILRKKLEAFLPEKALNNISNTGNESEGGQ